MKSEISNCNTEGEDEDEETAYHDSPALPDEKSVACVTRAVNKNGTLREIFKAKKSDFVRNLIFLDGAKFDFTGRGYLRPLYDSNHKRVLLKTARQVEKCSHVDTEVLCEDGRTARISDLKPGQRIVAMGSDGKQVLDEVSASSDNGQKDCVLVKTRLGSSLTITLHHPLRTLTGWQEAGALLQGDRVASLRTQGFFGQLREPQAELLGMMLGDGSITENCVRFTCKSPVLQARFHELYGDCTFNVDSRSGTRNYYVSTKSDIIRYFVETGLFGKTAADKELPNEAFSFDEVSASALLRGLWATDGHCKNLHNSKVDLVYCTVSRLMAGQVQRLLRKFGVVTKVRVNKPSNGGRDAYLLRVVTRKSVEAFYHRIGPIPGKPFSLPDRASNSNLDTLPVEIHGMVLAARKMSKSYWQRDGFMSKGLRINTTRCPTFEKIAAFNEVLQDPALQTVLDADIIWDEVVSIESLGDQPTWGIETGSQTYVADFIVNHNTTYLANNLTITSVVTPYNKSLYVSPSHTQTRQFSNEKLRPSIERSPYIKKYFQDSSVSTQVFEKGFTNGSYIFLRSAFRSADRCLVEGTRIYLRDGSSVAVENVGLGDEVISFDGEQTVYRKVLGKQHNGLKETLELTLESGHTLRASFDHRFLTAHGVKQLQDITGADSIPIPLGYLEDGGPQDETLALWVGMLLGDGCIAKNSHCSTWRCQFNNNDLRLIETFQGLCGELGVPCYVRQREQKKSNYTVCTQGQERITELLEPLGLLGTHQFTKFIPEQFFKSRSSIRQVLCGLIESDGWITCNPKSRQAEIGFVSGSADLARGVQRGLQSLGVYSQIVTSQPKKRQKSVFYTVKIRHTKHIVLFYEKVRLLSKQDKLEAAVNFIRTSLSDQCSGMDVPARADCAAALAAAGISSHAAWTEHRLSFRANRWAGDRIAQQKVVRVWEMTEDKRLLKWINPSVSWVKVKSINACGVRETWDVEIEGDPYFTANGVFTHNTRGISARVLAMDEIQDFLTTEIPVIMECTSHFPDATNLMAGTPKSHDNPIELYWNSTTQNEWMVPCQSCGKWNFLDETNVAPTELYTSYKLPPGPVCKRCAKPIYPPLGQWVSFQKGQAIQGYRIPQLMVPWITGIDAQWQKLLWKRDNYPFGQFNNEVLGLSFDSASKPITRDELMEVCGDYGLWDLRTQAGTEQAIHEAGRYALTGGVDWGEGNDGAEKSPSGKVRNASYTVHTIGGYVNQKKWKVLYIRKYEGRDIDPDFVVRDIARVTNLLGVKVTGVDWGHGWGVNNVLVRMLGVSRVAQFQYLPKLKQRLKWDPLGQRFHLQRNFMLSELFFDIKHGLVEFPRWKDFEYFARDILGIYTEYIEYRREVKYDHRPSDPDDFFHSLHYAKLMSDIYAGKSRRYTIDAVDVGGGYS